MVRSKVVGNETIKNWGFSRGNTRSENSLCVTTRTLASCVGICFLICEKTVFGSVQQIEKGVVHKLEKKFIACASIFEHLKINKLLFLIPGNNTETMLTNSEVVSSLYFLYI